MKSRIIVVDDFAIELLESDGLGTPVFLVHGNSSAADSFEPLLQSQLGRRTKLVALSLPGHGGSSSARDPEAVYNIPALGQLVAKVVAAYGESRYWLVGQSLGGHALTESLDALPGALGLLLISAPPTSLAHFAQTFKPDPSEGRLFKGPLDASEVELLADCFSLPAADPSRARLVANIRRTDSLFRPSLGASLALGRALDEREIVGQSRVPLAVLAGSEDRFLNPSYFGTLPAERLWRGKTVVFEGSGHLLHLDSPTRFEAVLGDFLEETRP
jgi:pimeloyl-ACP methyl ester carboxylesterase